MLLIRILGRFFSAVWTALDSAHAIRHGAPYSAAAVRRQRAYHQTLRQGPRDPLVYPWAELAGKSSRLRGEGL